MNRDEQIKELRQLYELLDHLDSQYELADATGWMDKWRGQNKTARDRIDAIYAEDPEIQKIFLAIE
jgi:hypothetical protein